MSAILSDRIINSLTIQPEYNVSMSRYTSFKTGGAADLVVFPVNEDELINILCDIKENGLSYTVIGRGTNILVADGGIEGVVIILTQFKGLSCKNAIVSAGSGTLLSEASMYAMKFSLKGLEPLSGIPGSIGGAVVMNAGAYGSEIKDVIRSVRYLDLDSMLIRTIEKEDMAFDYRKSCFMNSDSIILSADFQLVKGEPDSIMSEMKRFNAMRREKQPLNYPSAGSVFKRPKGDYAARLIDICGLKGSKVGGAKVSEKHAGFIINYSNATSADVIELIEKVRRTVFVKTGIMLETEIKIIGRK